MNDSRQMVLVGFLQAQNCSNYVGSWRHPASTNAWTTPEYYQSIARTLEHGRFHLAFFDDRLALPDRLGDSHDAAVRAGVRVVKMDPIPILMAMGLATTRLGLGATCSTTYYEPFHVARMFATVDLMLGGRVAWNVVTSLNDSEAANFGAESHLPHDLRYDRADEFMEVTMGHWDSWEDGALIVDKATGQFGDPAKVHRLDHKGQFFRSRGPLPVPRSPQGRPVIMQAGASGRGMRFSGRWADIIFVIYPTLDFGRRQYAKVKEEVAAAGRDPASVHVAPAAYIVPGETRAIAEAKMEVIERLAEPIDGLALLSEVLNFDFASKPMDEPFTDAEMAGISGLQAIRDRVSRLSGKTNPTARDFVEHSGRGSVRELPCFVGTPTDIADTMEEWFRQGGCDGFVVAGTHLPGAYEDFVRLVVPELQRRGLHRKEYAGATLRENLGLRPAERGDWRGPKS